jgi:glucose/arabinose dehydrogenase/predicted MPP superfamily phosphohydrolase
MLLKIIILTPLVFAFQIQLTNYITGNDTNHIHGLENVNLSDFNIAATGDWSCTHNTKNTVENIINKSPELVLGLGDYAYRNDAACWLEIIKPIESKMKIVIGNHDDRANVDGIEVPSKQRLEQYMNQFNLTEQFYSFDYQNVHFLAIATEDSYEKDSMQYRFVQNDLKNAASSNKTDWIVVFYHRIAYTSPGNVGSVGDFRDTYHPLFDKYGVDIVLQAHTHNYQRSFPISYNTGNSSNPIVTDNAISNYDDPNGQIFAIVGTGGSNVIHNLTGAPAKFTAKQFYGYGFLNLDFTQNGTTLVGEFHDNDKTTKDRFSITKSNIKQNSSMTSSASSPKLTNEYQGKFEIETVVKGLRSPTDMAFPDSNDPNDMIVLEKNKGTVQRIVNGELQDRPLIDVNVSSKNERGLLGITASESKNGSKNIYLYYTEANVTSGKCPEPDNCLPGVEPKGNRLYKYELLQDSTHLVNPKLVLELPAIPGPAHNGGKMIVGPDNNIFLVVGDLMGHTTKAQNYEDGVEPDGTGGVLRMNEEGQPLGNGYLGDEYPLNLYYAYGIRNSFGIDFDPLVGNLWDSENGPDFADEINLVSPGFNSGWKDVQGIWEHKGGKPLNVSPNPDKLAEFGGKGKYSEPEFTFFDTVGVTAIKFLDSDKFGSEYRNDLFVSDIKNGNVYHFDLNPDRKSLVLDGPLSDKIANTPVELDGVKFAEGFSGISDLEVGPDGYLYVLAYVKGTIYRIVPI